MNFKQLLNEIRESDKKYLQEIIFDAEAIVSSQKYGKQKLTKPVSANDEKDANKNFNDFIKTTIKNGHLPKDTKIIKINIKKIG